MWIIKFNLVELSLPTLCHESNKEDNIQKSKTHQMRHQIYKILDSDKEEVEISRRY